MRLHVLAIGLYRLSLAVLLAILVLTVAQVVEKLVEGLHVVFLVQVAA